MAKGRANLFYNGRSQAVRLPKEFRLPGDEVHVHWEGSDLVLTPIPKTLGDIIDLLARHARVDDSFVTAIREAQEEDRQQPPRDVKW